MRAPRLLRPRVRALVAASGVALVLVATACAPAPPPAPPPPPSLVSAPLRTPVACDVPVVIAAGAVPVMGACARVSVDQIVAWFDGRTQNQTVPAYRATVPLRDLVTMFLEEGDAEGVRGDIAFIQSIIETGWFNFAGRVPPSANNFSGFGATDGTSDYGVFPDARTGVRVQIQHLRAYADPTATTCTVPPLANPCVDTRFGMVSPKGKAPTWDAFGNGNWATDPTYATKILNLYGALLAEYGLQLG